MVNTDSMDPWHGIDSGCYDNKVDVLLLTCDTKHSLFTLLFVTLVKVKPEDLIMPGNQTRFLMK